MQNVSDPKSKKIFVSRISSHKIQVNFEDGGCADSSGRSLRSKDGDQFRNYVFTIEGPGELKFGIENSMIHCN